MSKDPAFLFYVSDFLTGTMFMNNEQLGIYIRLLCAQHQHGGLINKVAFDSMIGTNILIRSKFIETDEGYFNERLASEMEKRNKKSNNLSLAAKDIWSKRKEKEAISIQLHNNSNKIVNKKDTIVIQPKDVNEDIIVIKDLNKKESENLILNEIEVWFNDLENSSYLEQIAMKSNISIKWIKNKIPDFKIKCDLKYKGYDKFISHFKNWVLTEFEKEKNGNTKNKSTGKQPYNAEALSQFNNALKELPKG